MSERETLAEVLAAMPESYFLTWMNDERSVSLMIDVEVLAERILASDWLAARDVVVAAKALEDAANEADSIGHHWSGATAHAFFELASDLRDRAALLQGDSEPATKPAEPLQGEEISASCTVRCVGCGLYDCGVDYCRCGDSEATS